MTKHKTTRKVIKIPKNFWDDFKYKVRVPLIRCSCGKLVLDTPTNRENSLEFASSIPNKKNRHEK